MINSTGQSKALNWVNTCNAKQQQEVQSTTPQRGSKNFTFLNNPWNSDKELRQTWLVTDTKCLQSSEQMCHATITLNNCYLDVVYFWRTNTYSLA